MKLRNSIAVVALIALIGTAGASLTACGREIPAQALIGAAQIAPADRQSPVDVSGQTLTGESLDVTSLRGKVVVVNGWASWCEPCREEIPELVSFAESVDPDTIAVVGVNVMDEPAAATAFAQDLNIPYPSIVDQQAGIWGTFPGIPPRSLPSTVILDTDGRVAATIVGTTDAAQLRTLTEALVDQGS